MRAKSMPHCIIKTKTMDEFYTYRLPERRPIVWFVAIVFLVLGGLGLYRDAPWPFYLSLVVGGAITLYTLIKNQSNGVKLTQDHLILSAGLSPRKIPLAEVAKVEFVTRSHSTDMTLHLISGAVLPVYSGDIPPRRFFVRALRRAGVPVVER